MSKISTLLVCLSACGSTIEPGEYLVELRLQDDLPTGCPAPAPIQELDGWRCPLGSYDLFNPLTGSGTPPATCPDVLDLGTPTWEVHGDGDFLTIWHLPHANIKMSGPDTGGDNFHVRVEGAYAIPEGLSIFNWDALVYAEGDGFVGELDVSVRLAPETWCGGRYDIAATAK